MRFVYIEQIDDSIKVGERKLAAAIDAAIRPSGWKVSAMMDETQVTNFITGTNDIIKQACGRASSSAPCKFPDRHGVRDTFLDRMMRVL